MVGCAHLRNRTIHEAQNHVGEESVTKYTAFSIVLAYNQPVGERELDRWGYKCSETKRANTQETCKYASNRSLQSREQDVKRDSFACHSDALGPSGSSLTCSRKGQIRYTIVLACIVAVNILVMRFDCIDAAGSCPTDSKSPGLIGACSAGCCSGSIAAATLFPAALC